MNWLLDVPALKAPGVQRSRKILPVEPQHEPTPEEEDASLERLQEEDAQRYPGHENPEETIEPDPNAP